VVLFFGSCTAERPVALLLDEQERKIWVGVFEKSHIWGLTA
jgi:hypothetical protein